MPADQRPDGGSTTTARAVTTSRRNVLLAAVAGPAALAAGCSLRFGQPAADPSPSPPGADQLARARAAAQAGTLASSAELVARARPDLGDELAAIVADHRAHAAALLPAPSSATDASPTGGSTTGGLTTAPPASPTSSAPGRSDPKAGLRAQAAAERAAVAAVESDLPRVSGDLARLLASVAASRSAHVATLGVLARTKAPA